MFETIEIYIVNVSICNYFIVNYQVIKYCIARNLKSKIIVILYNIQIKTKVNNLQLYINKFETTEFVLNTRISSMN